MSASDLPRPQGLRASEAQGSAQGPVASDRHGSVGSMKIDGNLVYLDGNELATAIHAYLTAHRVTVVGARTIRIGFDGDRYLCRDVEVSVASDRQVIDNRSKIVVEG